MKGVRIVRQNLAASVLALAYLLSITAVQAQESAKSSDSGLQEIVVTAQRRGERLQDVPVAVTAFDAENLRQANISDAMDLERVDPSLGMTAQSGVVIPFLRGVGNPAAQVAGNEASVPVYIDDVYYTRLYAPYMELANVERVEVLKGPQGTLFGRNATGGLIQIFTRDPGQETELDATVGYANYQTISGKLSVSTPLSDTVAVGFSAAGLKQMDGWGHNFGNGKDTYRQRFYNLRGKLVADLTPTTRIKLSAFYVFQHTNQGTVQGKIYRNGTRGLPPGYTQQYIEPAGFYDLNTDYENYNRHRGWGGSLKIEQELGFADLVSISSYRKGKETFESEGDHTDIDFLHYTLNIKDRQITQEFQLKSPEGSRISWLLGAYYINSRQGYVPTEVSGLAVIDAVPGLLQQNLYGLQTINSYAGFGQATFPVIDERTNITLGLRYTEDHVKGSGKTTGTFQGGLEVPFGPEYRQKVKFDKVTYKVSVDHKFSDNVMAYASVSRGYKSGTFNVLPLDAPPTQPETVDAYEIGLKTELFGRHLRANIAIFQNDIKNPQVNLIKNVNGIASVQFANAGKARTKGVEFDATALLAAGFTLNLSGQYLYAKYLDFDGAPFNYPVQGAPFGIIPVAIIGDASGNRLSRAPKWKLNASATYEFPTAIGEFTLNGNMAYRSSYKWDPDNILTEPSLALFSASVTLVPAFNDHLSITLWGKNLSNEKYYSNELPQNGPVGYMGSVAEPRTYGIDLRYKL